MNLKSESMGSREKKYSDTKAAPQADRCDSSVGKDPSNCQMPVSPVNIKLVSGEN